MGFGVGNRVGNKQITLNDLLKGLDAQKDKKKIERITIAFNHFNKNKAGTSKDGLDVNEQIAMLNFMHKADGEDNDGEVTRRSLNKAKGDGALKYKDYKVFMEAYQNAINDDSSTVIFDARNREAEGTVVQNGGTSTLYSSDTETSKEIEKTVKDENGTTKYDQFGRVAMKKENGVTTLYKQFDSDKPDAKPTIIEVTKEGKKTTYTLTQTGLYEDDEGTTFRMTPDGKFELLGYDKSGSRLRVEEVGNKTFTYFYEDVNDNTKVTWIGVDGELDVQIYNRYDNKHYTTGKDDDLKYYTFDSKTHTFTEVDESAVKPKHKPLENKVYQNSTWYKQPLEEGKAEELKLDDLDNAEEVLDAIIASKEELNGKNINKETLLKDFIYNNPSIFVHDGDNKGRMFLTVEWGKLDFPHDLSSYILES